MFKAVLFFETLKNIKKFHAIKITINIKLGHITGTILLWLCRK